MILTFMCAAGACTYCEPDGCGTDLEDADGRWARQHFALRSEAETEVREAGWIVTTDGTVLCDGCAPDCESADVAVSQQVPGQGDLLSEEADHA
jgi:hypothetical protein